MRKGIEFVDSDLEDGQMVVTHCPRKWMPMVRYSARENGMVLVDARNRTWDKWLMISGLAVFVLTGQWYVLMIALWGGWDWARSYPRVRQ